MQLSPATFSRAVFFLLAGLAAMALPLQAQITWDFTTAAPSSGVPAGMAVSPLVQGNNQGTTTLIAAVSVSGGYPGASAGNNAGVTARTGPLNPVLSAYFETTLTPPDGFQVTLTGISFGTRSTSTGPQAFTLRTSADSFSGAATTGPLSNTGTWSKQTRSGLSLTSAAPLILRWFGHDGTGTAPSSTANFRIDDLVCLVSLAPAGHPVPTVSALSPDHGPPGTTVTITGTHFGTAPTVSFNGTPASGATVNAAGTEITVSAPAGASTGPVTVSTPTGSASSAPIFTLPPAPILTVVTDASSLAETSSLNCRVQRPDTVPMASPLTVSLSASPDRATVPASVVILAEDSFTDFTLTGVPDGQFGPSVAVTITASASGYVNGTATVAVTNTDPSPPPLPPSVVVNKWLNSNPELVELLVVGNGSAGSTLDMRGMILKDFSSSMANDGGGKRVLAATTLFEAVPAGTLIVITNNAVTTDTDVSDFSLRLGLADPNYFSGSGSGFDLTEQEMVMIKTAGSAEAGQDGAIHALAAGTADPASYARYASTLSFKLMAAGTGSAMALNSTATLADFNGTDGSSSSSLSPADFGKANNPANNSFLRSLRGIATLSGTGSGGIANDTPDSPFLSRNIFGRGLSGQTVALTVLGDVSPGILTRLSVDVPLSLGTPLATNVSISGTGAGTPSVSVTGQTLSITGTAVTTEDPALISIAGLITPSPAGPGADGRYPFGLSTAGDSGSPAPVAVFPAAVVIVPVESLRDVDATTGIPHDLNKIVAVDGIITEENFSNTQLSGFLQDGPFGINLFSSRPSTLPALIRGHRHVVTGTLVQLAGLTQLSPAASGDVIDLGMGTPPPAFTVTAAQLASPPDSAFLENLEGRLITVDGMAYVSGNWADPVSSNAINDVILTDVPGNHLTVRIAQNTTANAPPASYPAAITGILSQAAPANNLFSGYVLMPRDPEDLAVPVGGGYAAWASAFPGIGLPTQDADGDSHSNFLEYALGTLPNDPASVQQPSLSPLGGLSSFSIQKGSAAGQDSQISYTVEGSTDLVTWTTDPAVLHIFENDPASLTVQYPGTSQRFFFRLKVTAL